MSQTRTTEEIEGLLLALQRANVSRFSCDGLSVEFFTPTESPSRVPAVGARGGQDTPTPLDGGDGDASNQEAATQAEPGNPFAGLTKDDPLFDSAGKGA